MEFSQEQHIYTLEQLQRQIKIWRLKDDVITFTNGCFDILHRGHAEYLNAAAKLGDRLIIGVNSDASVKKLKGDSRPYHTVEDRAYMLASLHAVDAVIIFGEETPENLVRAIQPDILVKGSDYEGKEIAGAEFVKSNGGRVELIPFVEGYSTTSLTERLKA